MDTTIVGSIKKMLGLAPTYSPFDDELMMHIGSAIGEVTQLGIGPVNGFNLQTAEQTWADFLSDDPSLNNMVPQLVYMKVRLVFDTPESGFAITALKEQIEKLEWRVNVYREGIAWVDPDPDPRQETIYDGGDAEDSPFQPLIYDGGAP